MKIKWDANKCCHAGICLKTLPEVFVLKNEELTIDTAKAHEEEILRAARLCLAGALKIEE